MRERKVQKKASERVGLSNTEKAKDLIAVSYI